MLALDEKTLFFALITMNILIPAACALIFLFVLIPLYVFVKDKMYRLELWMLIIMVISAVIGYLKFGPLAALVAFFATGIVLVILSFIYVTAIVYLIKQVAKGWR